jgi:putative addiction module component (TIGR02574 family)
MLLPLPCPSGGITRSLTLQELGLDRLSTEDRLALAEALWQSVVAEMELAPLSEAQRKELERRLEDSITRPDVVTPWEVIKARAREPKEGTTNLTNKRQKSQKT